MSKVKSIVNEGCSELIVMDDGRAISQIKDSCSTDMDPKEVSKALAAVSSEITETIHLSKTLFRNVKIGEDLSV